MEEMFCDKRLFAILQKYDFSSKSQLISSEMMEVGVVCDTAKVRFFKQITTGYKSSRPFHLLFAILQKYDFSSKSQLPPLIKSSSSRCLRYCKSTIFQANHNARPRYVRFLVVVCDTAKVRFFKQITTRRLPLATLARCLRYCKSTIFQANHNHRQGVLRQV